MNASKGGGRRKQHGRAQQNRPRRKHKKPISDGGIEEQLRRQRKKQATEHKSAVRQNPQTLGNYRFDLERNAYFPADSFPAPTKKRPAKQTTTRQIHRNYTSCANTKCLLTTGAISFQSLKYATEISPFSTRQEHLRSIWAGRLLRMGMNLVPTTTSHGSRLLSMLPPLRENTTTDSQVSLDFVCKTRLHPSARTFDVCAGDDSSLLPSIATLVDGGSQVTFGHVPQVWTVQEEPPQSHLDDVSLRISPVPGSGEMEPHIIRFAPSHCQNPSNYSFVNICRTNEPHKSVMRLWCGDYDGIGFGKSCLSFYVNDVAFDPDDTYHLRTAGLIGVAPLCSGKRGSSLALLDIETSSCFSFEETAPKSDALCIERRGDLFFTGHRNGWLSITDLREEDSNSFPPGEMSVGSLTRIMVLNDGNRLLTKHSFGSCLVWDLRMMGSKGDDKMKPLLHLTIPKPMIHSTKSSCCNGIAMDPTQAIVISPFVNAQERTCLAFWSLSSSSFVGCKELETPESVRNGSVNNLLHCELSSTITSAFNSMTSHSKDGDTIEPSEHSWGLWFKLGTPLAGPPTPRFVSSIHHVTFPGDMTM